MPKNSSLPLHARTHWRRIKEIITGIAGYEHFNLTLYNIGSITCYETCGDNLQGVTVTYANATNESPWVSDNMYEIYEIPSKNNSDRYNFTGNFVFLAHNISFDYWLFGTITDKIDFTKVKSTKKLVEDVKYRVYGEYTIAAANNYSDTVITKTTSGRNVTYGGKGNHMNGLYDSFSQRKKAFCKKTNSQVLSELLGIKNSNSNVIDNQRVKKFKTRKKKID